MKQGIIILIVLFVGGHIHAQVGINTTDPETTLDVNGTLRVRELENTDKDAVAILGITENGILREVEVGENIRLIDNKLIAINRTLQIGDIPSFSSSQVDNVNFLIWPGDANEGKMIIRIKNTVGNTEITGIKAGTDGMHIWLYAVSGELKLIPNSVDSDVGNRIELNDKMGTKQYGMIELFYDATRGKWIVMQNHK